MNQLSEKSKSRVLLFFVILSWIVTMLVSTWANAQARVRVVEHELVTVHNDTTVNHSVTGAATLTEYTWHDSKGVVYQVWKSVSDKYFVLRRSQKSGELYKFYLKIEAQ